MEAHQQKKANVRGSYRVGVITPYRQQRKCLQDAFQALCGAYAKEVSTPRTSMLACSADHSGLLHTPRRMCLGFGVDLTSSQQVVLQAVIETVDSFQGKQMDVIIMSCVRASEAGAQTGIGFVSDIRRMNVAITRAKKALWILGSAATLKVVV